MAEKIELSESSISYIAVLCDRIQKQNPSNREMGMGITDYVRRKGWISHAQAQWLCQNADYWKQRRPKELLEIQLRPSKKQPAYELENPVLLEILRRVKRIEKHLKARD